MKCFASPKTGALLLAIKVSAELFRTFLFTSAFCSVYLYFLLLANQKHFLCNIAFRFPALRRKKAIFNILWKPTLYDENEDIHTIINLHPHLVLYER